jgi:hypothetical protein
MLAKRGSQQVYNTILKSRERMTVDCVVNAIGSILLNFYIFKGEIREDCIQQCKP